MGGVVDLHGSVASPETDGKTLEQVRNHDMWRNVKSNSLMTPNVMFRIVEAAEEDHPPKVSTGKGGDEVNSSLLTCRCMYCYFPIMGHCQGMSLGDSWLA